MSDPAERRILRIVDVAEAIEHASRRHLHILARGSHSLLRAQPGRAAIDLAPPSGPGGLTPTSVRVVRPAAFGATGPRPSHRFKPAQDKLSRKSLGRWTKTDVRLSRPCRSKALRV